MTKNANLIVVGGPISAGKSTLVNSLGLPQILEIDPDDKVQNILLKLLYQKERIANELIELYFLQHRISKYAEFSHTLQLHVLDRSVLESLWFAKGTLSEKGYKHFEKMWTIEVNELFAKYGRPKLYILLTMNWETFKKRIFIRSREEEVFNFQKNEIYFRKHIAEYEEWMENIFKKFDIKYKKIATDHLNKSEVKEVALEYLKEHLNE